MLTLIDKYSRECLAIDVAKRMTSENVLERLSDFLIHLGVPRYLRSDNGPEFSAIKVRQWLAHVEVKTRFIEPGSPWENGYIESFHGKLREVLLNGEVFETMLEAKAMIEHWRVNDNTIRPHSTQKAQYPEGTVPRRHSTQGYQPSAPETVQPHKPASATVQ